MITGKTRGFKDLRNRMLAAPREIRVEGKESVRNEARLFINAAIKITPPASKGVTGKKAQRQGEGKTRRDIRRVYGRPSDIYGLIKATNEKLAGVFWHLIQTKQWSRASALSKRLTGYSLLPFDGGIAHRNRRNNDGNVTGKTPSFYVDDGKALDAYLKLRAGHVGLLGAGFRDAVDRLGGAMPAWMLRHGSLGNGIEVVDTATDFTIIIKNAAPFAQAADMQRRMTYVAKYRQNALQRKLKAILDKQSARIAAR